MKLQSLIAALVKKARRAFIKFQLAGTDDRQRELVANLLFAMDYRMHAQQEFAEYSIPNAARKRRLLEKLDRLDGIVPPPAAGDAAEQTASATAGLEEPRLRNRISNAASEAELRTAADLATCCHAVMETDPLDWPLPCDIEVGGATMRRGMPLRTLAARVKVLHAMAAQSFPVAANLAVDPVGANAELNKTLV